MDPIYEFQHPNGVSYRMWYSPDKIGRAFASGNLYERPLLDWILAQNFRGSALDIGGNIGCHSLWMHHVCRLNVVAFEPVLPHVLRANAMLNNSLKWDTEPVNFDGIEVRDYALGDVTTMGHHKAKGVVHLGGSDQSTDEVFSVKRLDDIELPDDVAFVKIDVEGFEPRVLAGGLEFLTEQAPVLAVEQWTPAADKAVADVLTPMGYRAHEQFGGKGRAPMVVWRMA